MFTIPGLQTIDFMGRKFPKSDCRQKLFCRILSNDVKIHFAQAHKEILEKGDSHKSVTFTRDIWCPARILVSST
jgi:hypothetical protein